MLLTKDRCRALSVIYIDLFLGTMRLQETIQQMKLTRLRRRQRRMQILFFVLTMVTTLAAAASPRSCWALVRSHEWINMLREGTLYTEGEFYRQFRMSRRGFLKLYEILGLP